MVRKVILVVLGLVTASGLAWAGKPKGPVTEKVVLTGRVPVLDTLPGYPWQQTRGGVTVKLVPVPFEAKPIYHRTVLAKPKGMFDISSSITYKVTETPATYVIEPNLLTFQLHITNQLNTVLRLAGAIISFTADGKSLPVDTSTQNQLLKAIILPQGSLDLTIKGPSVGSRIPTHGDYGSNILGEYTGPSIPLDTAKTLLDTAKVITFAIYDMTVEVDAANNPTKRATFEWLFANKPSEVTGEFEKVTVEQKLMPADAVSMHDQWYFK